MCPRWSRSVRSEPTFRVMTPRYRLACLAVAVAAGLVAFGSALGVLPRPAGGFGLSPATLAALDLRRAEAAAPGALPAELAGALDTDTRKALFRDTLDPAIRAVNARVRLERALVTLAADARAEGRRPPRGLEARVAAIAARYGVPADDPVRLLVRVDTVPPALITAQAALESGWGRSRLAHEAHALFGERAWRLADGVMPLARKRGAAHVARAFPDITASVAAYVHNLNTQRAYAAFRRHRAEARLDGTLPDPLQLAGGLSAYSELGPRYVAKLRAMIRGVSRDDEMAQSEAPPPSGSGRDATISDQASS